MAPGPRGDAELPDPDRAHSQQEFSHELTLARRRAGLTVRQVARASGLPVSTVGDYFAGRHLPPPSMTGPLPKILATLGIDAPAEVGRWLRVLRRVRRPPGRRPGRGTAPYRGLASFQPGDAPWFFGREELTLHLVRLAAGAGATGLPLAVVGPSGSGKSSLLRAGLYPRLTGAPGSGASAAAKPGPRRVLLITPGAAPLPTLAAELAPAAGAKDPAGFAADLRQRPAYCAELIGRAGRTAPAIIVDQFEEVFTVCEDEPERQAFVAALTALSATTLVVIGLRADYYASALRYPDLARTLQDRQIVVGPMTAGQLRRTIAEPARKAGLDLEDGLVELLLRDMQPHPAPAGPGGSGAAGHEVGALPLLSHALLVTWGRATGNRLTVADYQATGGIRDAIAQTAEVAYGQLGEADRDIARQLFLRLVHVAEDARETRARVPLSELPGQPAGQGATVPGVLGQFVAQRLVTVDSARAEITHEALLDAWPRLRGWLDADAEDVRIWRFVGPAAQAWASAGRDPAALLRGGQLALARDWAASPAHHQGVSPLAREFVDASVAEDKARQAAQRRRTRRLRRLVAALTVLVVLTVGLAGYGFQQRERAAQAMQRAMAGQDSGNSRAVAFEADQMRSLDPALAAQLALAAYQAVPTSAALTSLLESSAYPAAARLHDSGGLVQSVAVSPGRHLLAAAGADGTLRLWDVARTARPLPLSKPMRLGSSHPLYATAISPNGQIVAVGGADKTVQLWDVADPSHPRSLGTLTGPGSTVYALTFSPDGKLLAAGSADKTVRLWDLSDPFHPAALPTLTGAANYVQAVAFSPDGTMLAAGSADKTVRLWTLTDPAHPKALGGPLTGPAGAVDAVAFSPDGRTLAAGSLDDKVWRWDVSKPNRPRRLSALTGATDFVNAVAFSPDGRLLAAASSDDDVRLWNAATGAPAGSLPHPQPVTSLAWDGPGLLATGDADGQVRLWRVPPPELQAGQTVNSIAAGPGGILAVGGDDLELWNPATRTELADAKVSDSHEVNAVAFSPGGGLVATGYINGSFQLWRRGTGLVPLGSPRETSFGKGRNLVEFVAFSPDGKMLATGEDDGTVRLWDVTDPAKPRRLATIDDASGKNYVYSVAFAPGGHTLAAASTDNLTRLWNVTDPAKPAQLATLHGPTSYAISVAFSPSGRVLAVGSADKTVRLWNVTEPAHPARLATLHGPGGYVYSVAFGPGGQTLAGGATDGSVWLWRVADPAHPTLISSLTGPAGHVYSVAFGPGGRTLAAGSSDGTVWQWDTGAGQAAAGICALAGQPLTRAEWRTYVPGRGYAPPCGKGRG